MDGVLLVAEQRKRRQVWAGSDLPCFFRSVITIALRLPNRTPETGKEKPKILTLYLLLMCAKLITWYHM